MSQFRKFAWFVASVVMACTAAAQVAPQQHHPPESTSAYIRALEDPSRVEWQKPDEVVEKLGLKAGEAVADLGAGSGYFTLRFAQAVGPAGKVYAVDVDRGMLDNIERRAKEAHLENIQLVLAEPHDPQLPASSVNMIFICDTLHHISDRATYYPLLVRALRPGGRLVNIDFHKKPLPVGPPVAMKIAKEDMIEEVKPAGFHVVKDFDFLPYQYFLIFQR
ncbi:MAG: methyltransferase domain-containing protein [Acidobacteriia bacterium]|nr:methyltransferase domain-containing protein [Terriglobia bacterium]